MTTNDLNWEDLKFFLAVARAGSIHRTALETGLVRSTIARRLDNLEATLRTRLFDRKRSGLSLTVFGKMLVTQAERIENEVGSVHRIIAGRQNLAEGTVKLTMPHFLSESILMEHIVNFAACYPSIELSIDLSSEVVNLDQREADLSLRYAYEVRGDVLGQRLATCAKAVYATPCIARFMTDTDGEGHHWIGSLEPLGAVTADWIKKTDFPLATLKHRASEASALLALARAGEGLVELPCFVGDFINDLVRVPFHSVSDGRELWLLRHRDLQGSKPVDLLVDHIVDAVKSRKLAFSGTHQNVAQG